MIMISKETGVIVVGLLGDYDLVMMIAMMIVMMKLKMVVAKMHCLF